MEFFWRASLILVLFLLDLGLGLNCGEVWAAKVSENLKASESQNQNGFGVEIDRIDIIGVTVFSTSEIENVLEVGAGDRLERLKVVRTEENLQTLYARYGYEEVSIQSRLVRKKNEKNLLETVLEFAVKEGRPFRIASIEFVPIGLQDEKVRDAWKKREKKLKSSLGFGVGDIYNQDKLIEGKRGVQEFFAAEEFIGTKVEDIRKLVPPPKEAIRNQGALKGASKWVAIEFKIDLGERVDFGFRGNTLFTRGYLDSLVDEQRLLGLGKDYREAIRSKIQEEYFAAGYARVQVVPYTFEMSSKYARKITYFIQEGPRVKIDSIDFDGNSVFSSVQLRKKFFAKASSAVQHEFYVEKDVQRAAELLVEGMKEKGYLSARVITTTAVYPPKPRTQQANSSVRLLIYLYEGDQTLVQNVAVQGATLLSPLDIQKILKVQNGDPINLFAMGEGIDVLKRVYRDEGYLGFRVLNEGSDSLVQYLQENRVANILLQLDEGPRFRVSHIEIEGLNFTHDDIVQRELRFKEGEILKESELLQSERRVRKLGIFSTVTFKTIDDPGDSRSKIVRITLNEADRGILTYGPGIRNDLGIRFFGQLSYTNLFGRNHSLSVSTTANRRFLNYHFGEAQAQVAYSWPSFGMPGLNFRPTVAVGRTQYYNFFADNLTAAVNWDKQLSASPAVMGYFSYTLEKIFQTGAASAIDNGAYQIASIMPKISVDFRDNPLAPTTGFFSTAWLDLSLPGIGSQGDPAPIGYYRAQIRSDYFLPISRRILWYFSFRTGYEQTLGGPQAFIPLIKQFAIGGIGSIRGYQEHEINNSNNVIDGSLAYVNYRTQIDLPVAGDLKLGFFVDAGNLLVNHYSFGGLRYGTGAGLHYQTPVGPVNFDWGFKVDPPPGADPYVIHFSVGII